MIKFIDGTTRVGKSSLIQAMIDAYEYQEVIGSNYDFLSSTCSNTDAIFTTFINFISRIEHLELNTGRTIVDRSVINDSIYIVMYSLANRVMLEHESIDRIEFSKLIELLDKYPNYYTPMIQILKKLLVKGNQDNYKFYLIESPLYNYKSYMNNITDKVEFHYIPLFKRFKGLPLTSKYSHYGIIDEVEELNKFYNYLYHKIMDELKYPFTVITIDNYKNHLT